MKKTIEAVKALFAMIGTCEMSDTMWADIAALTGRPQADIEALARLGRFMRLEGNRVRFA